MRRRSPNADPSPEPIPEPNPEPTPDRSPAPNPDQVRRRNRGWSVELEYAAWRKLVLLRAHQALY